MDGVEGRLWWLRGFGAMLRVVGRFGEVAVLERLLLDAVRFRAGVADAGKYVGQRTFCTCGDVRCDLRCVKWRGYDWCMIGLDWNWEWIQYGSNIDPI